MDNLYSQDDKIADISWFTACCEHLIEKHGDKYFVIQLQKIIGIYESYDDAIYYVETNNLLGKCSIQSCTNNPSGYTKHIVSTWF